MSCEMVERVAAAMWKEDARRTNMMLIARQRTPERFREQHPGEQAKWLGFARAAIEAMREPDGAMTAAADRFHVQTYDVDGEKLTLIDSGFADVWRAVIDAALDSQP